ncbi:hypothetical protein Taro_020100 [Colocasia esculenta]|uniref:Uncharacterized protein n=1 Tax=Colocasia esculenta TaxID=4460 RepID=A0A843V7I3_COLES|nr:hypothetical protein [Colocasia esculenta]
MNMNFDVPYEDMVRGARSGSSSRRRLSSGRGSSAALGSSPPTPPTFSTPATRLSASAPPIFLAGASTMPEAEDVVSLQEGGGGFYDGTLREVWINRDKIELAQASQFITRSIQAHFPIPIHRFNDFPMDVQELLY